MADFMLNPPILDSVIHAQSGEFLKIPFQMNRSVAATDVKSVQALIKSVSTNREIGTVICDVSCQKDNFWIATFDIKNLKDNFKPGQYYKIQLAYINYNDTLGFYSTVGTFKYTGHPNITIQNLDGTAANPNLYTYTGRYENSEDSSEKVYSYTFNIYELGKNTPIQTSGALLHNSSDDTESNSSIDTWTAPYSYDGDYLIEYKVLTINGLEESSGEYRITSNQIEDSNLLRYYNFIVNNVADGAYVQLELKPRSDAEATGRNSLSGNFIVLRASSNDNYASWYRLTEFTLVSWDSSQSKILCRDYSVEQGVTYRYALQAFNDNGIYSKRMEAMPVQIDFEDMYLNDGQRQLKIRFNPKVTSFKNTILESKMDTIGGQYPFFFRNGNVKYKEFPISGLISALMDDNGDFMSGVQTANIQRKNTPAKDDIIEYTHLSTQNFKRERDFKLEVLEWLTNGKPKLFRSPGEGNYIVRLMNTSLSPNDTLSRMLHTFTATAYEIAECSFDNLRKYGMLVAEKIEIRDLEFNEIILKDAIPANMWTGSAVVASLSGNPGVSFLYRLQNDITNKIATIGITGEYEFDRYLLATNPLEYIALENPKLEDNKHPTTLTVGYYADVRLNAFGLIDDIVITDKIESWIGQQRDEIAAHLDEYKVRNSIGTIYYLKVQERFTHEVSEVRKGAGGTYTFHEGDTEYKPTPDTLVLCDNKYYDGRTLKLIGTYEDIDFNFTMKTNDTITDMGGQVNDMITTHGRIVLSNLNNVDYLYLGNGLFVDIVYQFITKYYTIEKQNPRLAQLRKEWEANPDDEFLYNVYYTALINALNSEKKGVL